MDSKRQMNLSSWVVRPSDPQSRPGQRGQSSQTGQGQGQGQGQSRDRSARRAELAATAQETKRIVREVLKDLPNLKADKSVKYDFNSLPSLDPALCPRLATKARVTVVNEDSFNAALDMAAWHPRPPAAAPTPGAPPSLQLPLGRVAVLNLASHKNPGGGWLNGATAQEEALCYRSSLACSLHKGYYPFRMQTALYTRDVVIVREAMDHGHALLVPATPPADLPVVSVVSVAALCRPEIRTIVSVHVGGGTNGITTTDKEVFARSGDRELTKNKMRLSLRIAAVNKHRGLVLGALGCGAFANPVREVAQCWREVLKEAEFAGGWWQEVCFAVYDRKNEGNFEIFRDVLEGLEV